MIADNLMDEAEDTYCCVVQSAPPLNEAISSFQIAHTATKNMILKSNESSTSETNLLF